VPVTIVVAWQGASSLGLIGNRLMPSPVDVARAFWDKASNGELATNILASGQRALSGLLVGGSIGFALGLANGVSRLSHALTDTTLQMVRTIPNLALIPLVILWFGIGEEAKLFLTALGVFFPIYLNTLHGVRSVDPQLIEMGRVYGMNGWTLFRKVIFPGALPSIFVGLRFSLGIMWLTLIVAEGMAASSGIGHMANNAREFMMTDVVVLALVIYALLGKVADLIAKTLERLTLQWHPAFQRPERA
jgi:sulfonate transport system permease protein